MTDERPTDDRWLTYIEAGALLGLSPEAVRSIARRQKWPRQSPNAIGKVVRVLVPADRLRPVAHRREQPEVTNGHDRSADLRELAELVMGPLREQIDRLRPVAHHREEPVATNGHDRSADLRSAELREITELIMGPLCEQIDRLRSVADHREEPVATNGYDRSADLRSAELREIAELLMGPLREQLERAERRAELAEAKVGELQEQLRGEMVEHRRVVESLVARIPSRRSWLPWRSRRKSL